MRDIAVIIAIAGLALTAPASFGQIVAPTLSPPPCMGGHCLGRPRGATTQHVAGPSIQKRACPRGTVFDAYRGACRVMPLAR